MIEMQNLFIDTIRQLPHADIEKLTVELVKAEAEIQPPTVNVRW